MTRILMVEDDTTLRSALKKGLAEQGFGVCACASLDAARAEWARGGVDLVLLDLQLPDGNGLAWLREMRVTSSGTPVLIMTARDTVQDRVRGLDGGADDYLVKPFAFAELVARVRALLRRLEPPATSLHIGDLEMDLLQRTIRRGGAPIECTQREFDILAHLARRVGQPVSRAELAEHVWKIKRRMTSMDNVIDVQMSRLRDKIDRADDVRLIHTVRGLGFMLKGES